MAVCLGNTTNEVLARPEFAAYLVISLCSPVFAQTATPEALGLAKQLVAKIEPNPQQTIAQLGGSMVGMMQQMGIKDPEQAKVIVQEAMMPMLLEHIGGLIDRSAAAYAETISVEISRRSSPSTTRKQART